MKIAPSDDSYTTFCNLTTAYRMAAVINQAVSSGIIETIGDNGPTGAEIIAAAALRTAEGKRFLALLVSLGILEEYAGHFHLSQFSRKYLYSRSETNQLPVLEFERVLIDKWSTLGAILQQGQGTSADDLAPDAYRQKLALFQKAMHGAAVIRSQELWDSFPPLPETGLIIDLGAGDGTYLTQFLERFPGWQTLACDLQDVVGQRKNPAITTRSCNLIDPRDIDELAAEYQKRASIVLLSNLIHCYSQTENSALLGRVTELLRDDGLLVVHDFFTDGNSFGALYDAHMLLNTYNGRTYGLDEAIGMLGQAGFVQTGIIELPSYSHAILAARQSGILPVTDPVFLLQQKARDLSFFESASIDPAQISIEAWVKAKCRYGCMFFGRKWSCPPHAMETGEFRELLGCYSKAIVVAGQPPLKTFQRNLLELEKHAFLQGFKKALVFTGGPCCWCESCPDDRCRFPEKRRPSLESCGCDVFALAEACRISIKPVKRSSDFVQYIGLLLVE